MRKCFFFAAILTISQLAFATPKIEQVEPLNWWTNMETPLTVMFHGQDLKDAQVSVQQIVKGTALRGACHGLVPRSIIILRAWMLAVFLPVTANCMRTTTSSTM